ncbi:phosphotransferase family protein [Nocardioides pinisoli]|uniref:Aminoglycoside phosphotransferase family protein n=1 Tax=Nocardioides pinisoli TaxID=2950279 RepID=A0ABT1KYJ4_9ACTN|nr:aminoglycoside phosphotransferase family protein [Nocardioides pinisoli]MCP3422444.1 aminoglycoside phosphotransferase family protein [Nocardioides pinisoli]
MTDDLSRLRPEQRQQLARWIPDAKALADLSWGLVETKVLELVSDQGRLILKAGGVTDGHISREIRAHREWLHPWVSTGHAPLLLFGDQAAKMLVTHYLPGSLVEGTSAQDDAETYRQAGSLLVTFHNQLSILDEEWNDRFRARVERHLALPHRIDSNIEGRVRAEVSTWPRGGARVVPTHGDWQPRNWLIDDGVVRIIDFGRADLRPPIEDFVRLARQDFARDPKLEAAFIEGYGSDPREPGEWRRALVGEAVGTAVWAYGVGDEDFECFGHRLLTDLYAESD